MNRKIDTSFWSVRYILILLVALFAGMAFFCINSGVPLFVDRMGGGTDITGTMTLCYGIGAVTGCLLGGYLCNIWGMGKVLIIFGLCCAVFSFLPVLFPTLLSVVLMRVLQGIAYTCFSVALGSSVAANAPEGRLGESLGYMCMMMAIGETFGPVFTVRIVSSAGTGLLFSLCGLFFFVATFLSRFSARMHAPTEITQEAAEQAMEEQKSLLWRLIEKKALPLSVVFFFFTLATAFVWNYMALYVIQSGIQHYSLFSALTFVFMFIARTVMGRVIDQKGPMGTFLLSTVAGVAAFLMMLSRNDILFVISGAFYGFAGGAMLPLLNSACLESCPPERVSTANSTFMVLNNLSIGLGGLLWGWIINLSGGRYGCGFVGSIISVLLTGALGYVFLRKLPKRAKTETQ